MKMTLLEMTQNILSAMDSDEVNSIGDTVESMQVAEIIRETYYELFSDTDYPEHQKLMTLDALADPERPSFMKIPEEVKHIHWIKYDTGKGYTEVTFLDPLDFVDRVNKYQVGSSIGVTLSSGVRVRALNNQGPMFWTTFNDDILVFDGWNNDLESTLQETNSLIYASVLPVFQMIDSFTPDLAEKRFPRFLAEAKSVCFLNLKQVGSQKEEQRSRRGLVREQNEMYRANGRLPSERLPNFGRAGPRRGRPRPSRLV